MAHLRTLRSLNMNQQDTKRQHANQGPIKPGQRLAMGKSGLTEVSNRNVIRPTRANEGLKKDVLTRPVLTRSRAQMNLVQLKEDKPLVQKPKRRSRSRSASRKVSNQKKESKENDTPMELDHPEDVEQDQLGGSSGHEGDVEMMESDHEQVIFPDTKEEVENIDLDDMGNPQMAADYVNEIYIYLRQLEQRFSVKHNYLDQFDKVSLKPRMRNLLVDWLIDVHMQFSLLQETLYLCVDLLDRYLQVEANKVTTKQLQLVGVTCMFIAAKYEEMYPPEIGDFVYITDSTYSKEQILKMELQILGAINLDLGKPLALNFLRRNSKAGLVDSHVHTMAKFVMELCIVEYKMSHIPPSKLAAASLAFSLKLLDTKETPLCQLWTNTLKHYSNYDYVDFFSTLQMLAKIVYDNICEKVAIGSGARKKNLKAVMKKYSNKKFGSIAHLPLLESPVIEAMAAGDF